MPDHVVTDEKGQVHRFPDAATPEMIAQALGVKAPQARPTEAQQVANRPEVPRPQIDMQGSNLATAISAPKLSMQPGLPSAAQVPENAEAIGTGAAIGAPAGGLISGGLRALPFLARGTVGAIAGSSLGKYGGGEVGGLFSPEAKVKGEKIGSLVGGIAGGYAGARGTGAPTKSTFLNKILGMEEAPVDPVAAAVRTRTAAWLPTKVPPPEPPLGSPENPGWMAKLPAKMPKQAPAKLPFLPGATTTAEPLPQGSPTPFPSQSQTNTSTTSRAPNQVSFLKSFEPTPESQDLISRTKQIVRPGQPPSAADLKRAGDLTQAPLKRLQDLAKFGDELAKNEINRRLRNQ